MTFDPATHGQRFLPEYPPFGHSDHLPMAWFALAAIGATPARQQAFARAYLPRLKAMAPDHPHAVRVRRISDDIDREGVPAVLARRLPALAGGWHREAYHPLIRIGYGVEFNAPGEVAAGLVYLEAAGCNQNLIRLAQRLPVSSEVTGNDLFRRAAALGPVDEPADSFTGRAERALEDPAMGSIGPLPAAALRELSRAALAVFAASHDFFALHLLTASHAFRLLEPWLGSHAAEVFALGLLAGYRATGAPDFPDLPAAAPVAAPTPQRLLRLCTNDEHDIKLAHAAAAHATHWNDARFLSVAEAYLVERG